MLLPPTKAAEPSWLLWISWGGGGATLPITSTAPGALESTGSILHAKWTHMVIGGHNNDIVDWWVPETDPHPLPTNLPRLSLTPGRPPHLSSTHTAPSAVPSRPPGHTCQKGLMLLA